MDRLAAVRFNSAGKYYYFSTDLDVKKGDKVKGGITIMGRQQVQ